MPIAQELIATAIHRSGLAALVRHTIARRRLSILVYHDPEPERLDAHLAYLAPRYTLLSLDAAVAALEANRLPPRALVLTFDDGHRGNARLADVLARHGGVATIYACSQIVGTARHFWFLDVDDPEPLKPLPNDRRLAEIGRASCRERVWIPV